jgi:hypothetical protein
MTKEKVPVTHMELVRDNMQKVGLGERFEKNIKKYNHRLSDFGMFNFYRYVAYKSLGIDMIEMPDGTMEVTAASVQKALGLRSMQEANSSNTSQALEGITAEAILYDYFWKTKKVFRFRDSLVEKLRLTHLKKVDTFFLRLPFESVVIATSDESALKISDVTHSYKINEIYLAMEERAGKKSLSVQAFDNKGDFMYNTQNSYSFSVSLEEGDILKQVKEYNNPMITDIVHFVLSALLYLNSSQPDINPLPIKKSPMEKLLRKQGQGNTSFIQYAVGSNITIDRSWTDGSVDVVDDEEEAKEKKYRSLTPRWLVRGHWRAQRYGANRSESKIIWIEPFEKGKDLSKELMDTSYNVKYEK